MTKGHTDVSLCLFSCSSASLTTCQAFISLFRDLPVVTPVFKYKGWGIPFFLLIQQFITINRFGFKYKLCDLGKVSFMEFNSSQFR